MGDKKKKLKINKDRHKRANKFKAKEAKAKK
jgi:hypothetical protein